jgi:hypothetical protein
MVMAKRDWRTSPGEHPEGTLTTAIEHYTSQAPSGLFLSMALGCAGVSALLHLAGRKQDAQFIGYWVPTILILGLYNKLVRLEGSD